MVAIEGNSAKGIKYKLMNEWLFLEQLSYFALFNKKPNLNKIFSFPSVAYIYLKSLIEISKSLHLLFYHLKQML